MIGHAKILSPFSRFQGSGRLQVQKLVGFKGAKFVPVDTNEYYDGDELVPVSGRRKFRNSKLVLGFGILILAFTGLTFAASLSLNTGNVEFGQGIYQIKSCDQWVGINLVPTAASYSGQSRVANIQISGLDALRCRGSNFKIQLYPSGVAPAAMKIFTDASGEVDRLLLSISSDNSKTRANAISFIDGYGRLVTSSTMANGTGYAYDGYEYLTYATTNGVYTVAFLRPLATMNTVSSLTVQSASQ